MEEGGRRRSRKWGAKQAPLLLLLLLLLVLLEVAFSRFAATAAEASSSRTVEAEAKAAAAAARGQRESKDTTFWGELLAKKKEETEEGKMALVGLCAQDTTTSVATATL